jgi:hypothetical protein
MSSLGLKTREIFLKHNDPVFDYRLQGVIAGVSPQFTSVHLYSFIMKGMLYVATTS